MKSVEGAGLRGRFERRVLTEAGREKGGPAARLQVRYLRLRASAVKNAGGSIAKKANKIT